MSRPFAAGITGLIAGLIAGPITGLIIGLAGLVPAGSAVASSVAAHPVEHAPASVQAASTPRSDMVFPDDLAPTAARRAMRGVGSVTVVRVAWKGGPVKVPSAKKVRRVVGATSRWYDEASGGRFRLAKPKVTPVVRLPRPGSGGCWRHYEQLGAAAIKKTHAGRTDHAVVYLPCQVSGAAGVGDVGDGRGRVWMFGYWGMDVLAHEIGHNLGLGHANTVTCKRGGRRVSFGTKHVYETPFSSGCYTDEYGDNLDLMGSGYPGGLAAAELDALGWLGRKRVLTLSATVDLAPVNAASSDAVHAVVVKSGHAEPIWIELRTDRGNDADHCGRTPSPCGVQLRYEYSWPAGFGSSGPGLVDATPGSHPSGDFSDASLPVGSSVTTPNGIRITVLSQSETSARVSVTYGAGASSKPAAPSGLQASIDGETAHLVWQPADDHGAAIVRYRVTSSDGRTRVVRAGRSATTFDRLTPGASYTFTVAALNERGWSAESPSSPSVQAVREGAVADLSWYDGQTYYGGANLWPYVTRDPMDPQPVTAVELLVDGVAVVDGENNDENGGDDWQLFWDASGVAEGDHELRTRTTDAAGTVRESDPITVTLVTPLLNITSPAAGSSTGRWLTIGWSTNLPTDGSYQIDASGTWDDGDGYQAEGWWDEVDIDAATGSIRLDLDDQNAGGPVPPGPFTVVLNVYLPGWSEPLTASVTVQRS